MILDTVQRTHTNSGTPVGALLHQLGISRATYYRWTARAKDGRLVDQQVDHRRVAAPPTPAERQAVCDFALTQPLMGYKRLAWVMVDQDIAYLRPGQLYHVLQLQQA